MIRYNVGNLNDICLRVCLFEETPSNFCSRQHSNYK